MAGHVEDGVPCGIERAVVAVAAGVHLSQASDLEQREHEQKEEIPVDDPSGQLTNVAFHNGFSFGLYEVDGGILREFKLQGI
jgi:hypothetical protein